VAMLNERRRRDEATEAMKARVAADMAKRLDTGVRPNPALAMALGAGVPTPTSCTEYSACDKAMVSSRRATGEEARGWFGQRFLDETDIDMEVLSVGGVETFVVAESLLLSLCGLHGERGLYLLHECPTRQLPHRLGRYSGTVLAFGESPDAASIVEAAERRGANATMLLPVWNDDAGAFCLLDGQGAGPPDNVPWQYANDAIGTGKRNNMQITREGDFMATRRIPALQAGTAVDSELCWSYDKHTRSGSESYWRHMTTRWWHSLGCPVCPAGHQLSYRWSAQSAITCDSCARPWSRGGANYWGCAICDFDSCEVCLKAPRATAGDCTFCGLSLDSGLRAHHTCVAAALDCREPPLTDRRFVAFLDSCAISTLIPGTGMLHEVDVVGDGSCWVYALLAFAGRLRHTRHGGNAPQVPHDDRIDDKLLRGLLCDWLATHPVDSFHTTDRLRRLRLKLPSSGRRFVRGEYGGDTEFCAWAAIAKERVFTISSSVASDGFHGTLVDENGVSTVTLSRALQGCLRDGRILRLARHVNGNHWHAYLPVARGHAQAHPICAPLSDVAERMAASRWLIEYDRRVDAGGT
jgi:hypothetical protein